MYDIPCDECWSSSSNRRINVRRDEHRNAIIQKTPNYSLAQHIRQDIHKITRSVLHLIVYAAFTSLSFWCGCLLFKCLSGCDDFTCAFDNTTPQYAHCGVKKITVDIHQCIIRFLVYSCLFDLFFNMLFLYFSVLMVRFKKLAQLFLS